MNVGWIGLGKLGLPCAVALDRAGHAVVGYDVSDAPARHLRDRRVPYREAGLDDLLDEHDVTVDDIAGVVAHADVVFVAVQTPHDPAYDGTTPAPAETRDFEYGYLVEAVRAVAAEAHYQQRHVTIVVVSTCLPGTFNRHLRPLANEYVRFVYNPFFIAMGTTVADFTLPEFVLLGVDDDRDAEVVVDVYGKVHNQPVRVVSIESAELTKVAYNVYLSAKIAFANYVGEICDKTGADADEVTDSLAFATDRIISPRYMRAGMGDGGGCHPRDLIALSHLAERLGLSHDLAADLMAAREDHSAWLAEIVDDWARLTHLPVTVLGRSYKPQTNLVLGSPSALLVHHLDCRGVDIEAWWDPHVDDIEWDRTGLADRPTVAVVTTAHAAFTSLTFAPGSVVIDPFGMMPTQAGVTLRRVGRKGTPSP